MSISENNIYLKSRKAHKMGNGKCLTKEQAAAKIPVDAKTLGNYESGKTTPQPDVVCRMSNIYKDPGLRRYYCSEVCEIGKTDKVYTKPNSLYSSGYKLINANSILEEVKDMLFDILADGKVDEREMEILDKDIPLLIKEVKAVLNEIEIEIEKKDFIN